jgi:CDP-glycerol glycerophosphotransferase (TagB/SpsB family)
MHPSHSENYVDFLDNDICDVIDGTADYQEIFKTASLLITDYSSVAFDFAYLNKPVLYTQFDKKSFFEKHLYIEGYFSYEKDGFGPVVYDYDSTVNEIIKFIENDCKLDKKYEKRIDKFYKYRDKNNCKRVYEEIKKLDEK